MTAYTGTFVKKDGTERTMTFIKVEDLPTEFLETKLKNSIFMMLIKSLNIIII